MTVVVINHDHRQLPPGSDDLMPVQIYGLSGLGRGDISTIGNPVVDKIRRLGVSLSPAVMDFLTIALAVTAADTFVRRENAADGWTRELTLQVPLCESQPWVRVQPRLERALRFLSGDIWRFEFTSNGFDPPVPYRSRDRFHLIKMRDLDCTCLFSGGLDSAIGAIDLLETGRKPLLVSHAYKGDKSRQDTIAGYLQGRYSRFSANAHPRSVNGRTDISMRTRSINFLAFAVVGSYALKEINQLPTVELFIPENGFISLNAPLSSRRIGSLSTRTTHPYFLSAIQEIIQELGIAVEFENPYQFQTKGEMVVSCRNRAILKSVVEHTVSCSHWKRYNQQCGSCVPCLIRRSALKRGGYQESDVYRFQNISDVLKNDDARDDLLALSGAISQLQTRSIGPWILDSGPLPPEQLEEFKSTFVRGLEEIKQFLQGEGVL